MNRKKSMAEHAVKKAGAVLHILLTAALLFGSRSTVMTVHAENEMTLPAEETVLESGAQPVSEEMMQMQADAAAAQEESAEEVPVQAENAEGAAQAETGNAEETLTVEGQPIDTSSVTMIGDSIMLGAASSIKELLPDCVIDAKVGRQMVQADEVITSLESQNALGQIVVIGLGTNGPFSVEKGQALVDRLGSGRTVYWVTVYGKELSWQEESNATIRALAENNENVHLIEWPRAASEHAEWICADGIHLSAAGRTGYAGIVQEALIPAT